MIFPPTPPAQGLAHGLEIKRARYTPAMHKQQTQFLHSHHIALPTGALRVPSGIASTIKRAAFG
ncbi:hypothetical protein [Sphingorhabdus sp.]|uniref:hypothetical protein n=1 Tax=Sphingorhabdus sp. TaxID=1902408 RepID=UPI0037C6286F